MARRRRRRSTVTQNVYYSQQTPGGGSLFAAIISLFLTLAICAGTVVTLGPVIDYFGNMLATQPDNPYKVAVMPMFSWTYAFITLEAVLAFVVLYRVIVRNVVYSRWT